MKTGSYISKGGGIVRRVNAYLPTVATHALESYITGHLGKEGVVLADTHVVARMKMCAALPHQYGAGMDGSTRLRLHAQTLGIAVASVTSGAYALLMRKKLQIKLKHDFTFSCTECQ